jgi:hypothetical protein
MDMRALKVGQHVTLSDALPGGGTAGVVREAGKYVAVTVAAQIEGKDGAYYITFNNDGSLSLFYGWIDASTPAWDWVSPCPIPDLKIISSCD